jgi:hypothetical protein
MESNIILRTDSKPQGVMAPVLTKSVYEDKAENRMNVKIAESLNGPLSLLFPGGELVPDF